MKKILFGSTLVLMFSALSSCQKETGNLQQADQNEEASLKRAADEAVAARSAQASAFQKQYGAADETTARRSNQNLVQVAQSLPIFKSLVAAVVKTGLAPVLSSPDLNATVFAPT